MFSCFCYLILIFIKLLLIIF
eukprot:UN06706